MKFFNNNQNLKNVFTKIRECGNMGNMIEDFENLSEIKVMNEQITSPADAYYNAISNHFVKLMPIVQQGIGLLLE